MITWEIVSWSSPSEHLTDKGGYHAQTVCINNMVYVKHLLSFWESGILLFQAEDVYVVYVTNFNKHLGHQVSSGFPWGETSHICCWEESVLCVTLQERRA